jgi:hypothetical protein
MDSGFDDWVYWHFCYNYNQLWELTINDCLRLAPFLTGLWVSSFPLWLPTELNEEWRLNYRPTRTLNSRCSGFSRVLHFITSGESDRDYHLKQFVVILPFSWECVFANICCPWKVCQSMATLWPLPAYPLQRESVFTEPLLSNDHIRHNIFLLVPDCGVGRVVSNTASYSELSAIKSVSGVRQSWLRGFAMFLSPYLANVGIVPQIDPCSELLGFGLCPSAGILKIREHNTSETQSGLRIALTE